MSERRQKFAFWSVQLSSPPRSLGHWKGRKIKWTKVIALLNSKWMHIHSMYSLGQAFSLAGACIPHWTKWVRNSAPAPDYSLHPGQTQEAVVMRWMIGFLHSQEKQRLHSWLLALTRSSQGQFGHLGSEPVVGSPLVPSILIVPQISTHTHTQTHHSAKQGV